MERQQLSSVNVSLTMTVLTTVTAIDQRPNVYRSVQLEFVDVSPPVKPSITTRFVVVLKVTREILANNATNVSVLPTKKRH